MLYNPDTKQLRKSFLLKKGGDLVFDETLDTSSFYGVYLFTPQLDEYVRNTLAAIENKLFDKTPSGGSPRYEHDNYFLTDEKYLGNPWILTTLWLAQYYIKNGQKDRAVGIIDWALSKATPSGMLSEQVNPETGTAVGVLPLVWSHSTLAETLLMLAQEK